MWSWERRPSDPAPPHDSYGDVGPTISWGGEVVGGCAVRPGGSVATELLTERGAEASEAVGRAAEVPAVRLAGTVVVPALRAPRERRLSAR